jgi:RNA-directed DNA polymerase
LGGEGLERKLGDLYDRIHRGAYRAQPSRRVYIPKPDGRERPLGIAALEDKIVQRALVEVLNAIWEEDFLGFSYGFRQVITILFITISPVIHGQHRAVGEYR